MKAFKLFEEAEREVIDKNFSRREALTKGLGLGLKAAAFALPFGLADALTNKAQAAPATASVVDILNFALTLEYLESAYYTKGLATSGLIPASDEKIFMQIGKHEAAHVALLQNTITALKGTPVKEPTFDFTAGGTFADVFSNYQTFLAVSNAFEDTGVRAYKGQAPNLMGSGIVLQAALDIHTVEARHASQLRRMRGIKGWITNAEANGLPGLIYQGEENTDQLSIDVRTIDNVQVSFLTQAWDEPLPMEAVLRIAGPFIKA